MRGGLRDEHFFSEKTGADSDSMENDLIKNFMNKGNQGFL
jgi:hypothetical protein